MSDINRRDFVRLAAGATLAGLSTGFPYVAFGAQRRVVVVGGGVGGCTAAKYLRKMDSSIEVILIEADPSYQTCFLSNEVLSGERTLQSITFGYDGIKRHGVRVVHDTAVGIDPDKRTVQTAGGHRFTYDRCVVSPGVDFKWDAIKGYGPEIAETIPHAWYAGPQTLLLGRQLEAMKDGGTAVIVAPPNPYKCPPAPYERASQIAMYFKRHKPRSKVLILDPKDAFSKQSLFIQGWARYYGYGTAKSMITWVSGAAGGEVDSIDAKTRTLHAAVEDFTGDVVNLIPAQKAGRIAFDSDLVDGDWCPVDKKTFESKRHGGIHVLGDASDASKMPKSAYAASSQAKVAAAAIVDAFQGREPGTPSYFNACYSLVAAKWAISVADVYRLDEESNTIAPVPGAGGVTPANESAALHKQEAVYAHSWYNNLVNDMLG